jgi:hypothetical protein
MAATSGDVAQIPHIEVDQVTGMGELVAADRLAGGLVQIAEAADPAATKTALLGKLRHNLYGASGCTAGRRFLI